MFVPLLPGVAPLVAAAAAGAAAPDSLINLVPLILAIPLAGFVFTAVFGRRIGRPAFVLPLLGVTATWLLSMAVVYQALTGGFGENGAGITLYRWIPAGAFTVDVGFFVDQLTACLLIVVTTIGMVVHLYSVGYMAHDPGRWRFFAYLNLFMFSMLLLVLADNFLVVFAGWELVGLSSYLLIGFWYPRRSAALAAKKAFIVNRVGDVGFALGIMLIWVSTGTLNMREAFDRIAGLDHGTILVIALLVFCGAVGKSAQFPLHVWLPDAMEGPTPVSALIHAATMVNAGVYLVARTNPIFSHVPEAMVVVAAIGIFTAILAASIAFTQTDIKRVLAYSTLSQLGYMFAALGVGAYVAAIFHLMAHGFFKGLLFLGSGSVIHSVHDEQDMNRMGALWRRIPDHPRDDAGRHDRDRGHPAVRRLLLQGRDPGRGVQAQLRLGLGDRRRRGRHDGLLHVAPDGQDVLRPEPRRPGRRTEDPRVDLDDDAAADPARDPVDAARALAGAAVRQLAAHPVAAPGLRRRGGDARPYR